VPVRIYNAGYKWEVVDTETGDAMCATPTPELAELIAKLLTDQNLLNSIVGGR
jgi:hypothetical protein